MSQATEQVKKVKGEGFKWGQELLKAKAIIKEQQEKLEELTADHQVLKLQYNEQIDKIEELTDRANWTNEECINHLQENGYYVETLEAYEEEIESWRRSDLEAELEDVREELENLKTDRVAAFELLDKDPNYFVCTTEERDKLWTEEDLKLEGYVLTKGELTQFISQHDEEDILYWGATNGCLTIFRLPKEIVAKLPEDCDFGDAFGNKWCLGEEWGGLTSACFQTITQEMIDNENFEQEQGYSDSEDDSDNEDKPAEEEVKKPEAEAKPSEETDEGCCTNCNVFLDEDMHIFCYSRGDEEETVCKDCGEDLHEEMKANGWLRDDDEGYEEMKQEQFSKQIAAHLQSGSSVPITVQVYGLDVLRDK
jgi:hypothetical protein